MSSSADPNAASPRIVLKPKLRAPSPSPELVARPRLLSLLKATSECRLTLVSAPAGYGKTTLLSQWHRAHESSMPFAWISLDEQDNDPVRMWRHVVEAVRLVVPEQDFGSDVLVALSVSGQRLIEVVLPTLINGLAELPHKVVLVLDDYQYVTGEDSHESVAFFTEHLPESVHLVISSRSDPPLPLGRLRARREMNEIRIEHLVFSEEEATCLLNEKMGLDISPDDVSVLVKRTEGWPAAIYLAGLSMQNKEDKHAFIESFGGSNRYIVDLLGVEVLASVPEEVREFLLMTSVLRRMTGPYCDAVVGREGSSIVLRELARSNLFVVPLDEGGEWYRYHNLFSELLLYELRSKHPEMVPILHERASVWSEGAGFFEGAIRQAIAAEDNERVGLLVARHWFGYVTAGQTATVKRWLEWLPEEMISRDASLVLVKAWISALSGRQEEAENLLAFAESIPHEGPLPDGTVSVEVGATFLRATFGFGGIQNMVKATRRATALNGEQTSPRAALVRFGLGAGLYLSGDTAQARKPLEETLGLAGGQPLVRMVTLSFLSYVATDEGHLEQGESFARAAGALVERFQLHRVPQADLAPIALGRALAERGKLEEAQKELEGVLSERRKLPGLSPWPTLLGLLALASVRSAQGDRAGGRAVLAEARAILEPFRDDAGIFPELIERQERKLRSRKSRAGQLGRKLTERELDVLKLIVGGLSTQQMAQNLYVAPSTVNTHIKSVYRKLGVSSRKQAAEEARAKGLL